MRVGNNPSKIKGSPAYNPTQVGIASLTYIPALEGYFRESLDVLSVHLASLRDSLNQDCDLHVFDNGSCPEVIDFLQEQWQNGLIDWLSLSQHNLGKNGALNWIFSAMPNDFIAYSDSDVFFRPGWLEESLSIFDSFDKAGMVSAQPVFFDFLRGQGKTHQMIDGAVGYQLELLKPRSEIIEEYCDGINASEELRQQFNEQELQVAVNNKSGKRAVTTATDMQFMLSKEVARKLVPLPIAGALTARDAIDIPLGIEKLGYWLLSSAEPLVWHIGNTISGETHKEVDPYLNKSVSSHRSGQKQDSNQHLKVRIKSFLSRVIRNSNTARRVTERIYGGLFSLLYEESTETDHK